jgi:aspartyl-tRNA(Asn)/glutamyl-tRNA(Gln) amidotransferase subunit A
MAGKDDFDSTASTVPIGKYSEKVAAKPYKMAYFDAAILHEGMDSEIKIKTLDYLQKLRDEGHQVESVTFDLLDFMIPAYYVLTTAEASSNLSRYDGVRYGYRSPEAKSLEEVYTLSRTEGFSMEVKKRIMLGAFVLSAGYYDAYYTKAQQIRRLLSERTKEILAEYDFIILPVSPTSAGNIGEASTDVVAMYLADIYTVYANMVGMPAIAFPIGVHSEDNMPIGIQLMASKFEEQKLLACAAQLYY